MKKFNKFIYRILGKGVPESQSVLDQEYKSGRWSYLLKKPELPRQYLIASLIENFDEINSILELGCGEGAFAEIVSKKFNVDYTGLDLSSAAIFNARKNNKDSLNFIVANYDEFKLEKNFDIILFNESLEYSVDPFMSFSKYIVLSNQYLIISMYRTWYSLFIWWKIESINKPSIKISIKSENGLTWDIKVFKSKLFDSPN